MTVNIQALIRKNIKELAPYASARSEFSGQANIFLDANENAYGAVVADLPARYPDPLATAVVQKLSTLKKVSENQIVVGNGSDEVIDLLVRAFCEPNLEKILITPPTFPMYAMSAGLNAVEVIKVQLDQDFQLVLLEIKAAYEAKLKIIFLCSPNNPSGNLLKCADIESVLQSFNGLVVVDEAYIDFCETSTLIPLLKQYNNLVILQTLSKAWGLAGLRCGYAIADQEVIEVLKKVKAPYNVNQFTQAAVLKALDCEAVMKVNVEKLNSNRENLIAQLQSLNCVQKIYPADANFLLVKFTDADLVFSELQKTGIIVRNRSKLKGCENCLRITVGTESENTEVIKVLGEINL